jgi:hypothetical protein
MIIFLLLLIFIFINHTLMCNINLNPKNLILNKVFVRQIITNDKLYQLHNKRKKIFYHVNFLLNKIFYDYNALSEYEKKLLDIIFDLLY